MQKFKNKKSLIIGFTLLLALILLITYFSPKIRDIDTVYTTGFTGQKFENISMGMSKSEVEDILAEPFYKTPINQEDDKLPQEWWQYSKTGRLGFVELNDFIGGNYFRIFFNKEGKVVDKQIVVFY